MWGAACCSNAVPSAAASCGGVWQAPGLCQGAVSTCAQAGACPPLPHMLCAHSLSLTAHCIPVCGAVARTTTQRRGCCALPLAFSFFKRTGAACCDGLHCLLVNNAVFEVVHACRPMLFLISTLSPGLLPAAQLQRRDSEPRHHLKSFCLPVSCSTATHKMSASCLCLICLPSSGCELSAAQR